MEKQIYASQGNFTKPLVVMVETFRRSDGSNIMLLKKKREKVAHTNTYADGQCNLETESAQWVDIVTTK